jgi:mannose-6-phosphate isomerase-like protein (cupin superfamily)
MKVKAIVFQEVESLLQKQQFEIINKDLNRPWGGFFVIEEKQALKFAEVYFPMENFNDLMITEKLSPKILIVAPGHRLSWQYHNRRAEIWKCIGSDVQVITSENDNEDKIHLLKNGDILKLKQGKRHRLVGLEDWGLVAEIWQHTDSDYPSDEDDIIRLKDDYSRK